MTYMYFIQAAKGLNHHNTLNASKNSSLTPQLFFTYITITCMKCTSTWVNNYNTCMKLKVTFINPSKEESVQQSTDSTSKSLFADYESLYNNLIINPSPLQILVL